MSLGIFTAPVLSAANDAIEWHPWSPATFELAQTQRRMIFVDVGIEGCTACRRMGEVTLSDAMVIERLNEHFVSIQVDAEARPDIGERFSDWAWPALIFMAPDATQVLAIRGNKVPANFLPILDQLIARQTSGELSEASNAPYSVSAPLLTELDPIRDQTRAQLDRVLNESLGSWRGNGLGAQSWRRYEHLRFRAHLYENKELSEIANRSAASHLKLIDPVWGGVFQAWFATDEGSVVVPEKRLTAQAGALRVFSDAYQVTREARYRRAIERVDEYLQDWMRSEHGTYFSSQRHAPAGLPARLSARDYWNLRSAHERRQFGIPPIDHAIYTDKNAQVLGAYVRAFEATTDQRYLDLARTTARALIQERQREDGWIGQTGSSRKLVDDERLRPQVSDAVPYLSAQVWMGLALLDLHRADADESWLIVADDIANAMLEHLHDAGSGGFFAAPVSTANRDFQRKPLEANAVAARFLYRLGVLKKDSRFAALVEPTIRSVAVPAIIAREGKVVAETGLTLELMRAAYVEFSVVAPNRDRQARTLYDAALAAYQPRKVLHFEAPGRYPEREAAALYICNPDYCTPPLTEPDQIQAHLASFHRAAETPYP